MNLRLGYSVPITSKSRHRINCFPIENINSLPPERSNDRYDYLIALKKANDDEVVRIRSVQLDPLARRRLKKKLISNKDSERGISGACVLRDLKYFDVGFSFVSDSLHNIYHGAFVCTVFPQFRLR